MWNNIADYADREESLFYCGCCEYGAWFTCFRRYRRVNPAGGQNEEEQDLFDEDAEVQEPIVVDYQGCNQWLLICIIIIIYVLLLKYAPVFEELPLLDHVEQ